MNPRELTNEQLDECKAEALHRGLIYVELADIAPEQLANALFATEAGRKALAQTYMASEAGRKKLTDAFQKAYQNVAPDCMAKALLASPAGRKALAKALRGLQKKPPYFALHRKLTSETIAKIRNDVGNGTPRTEAARKYNVSVRSVARALSTTIAARTT